MGLSRQAYWSELLFPYPGDLPKPGNKAGSPASQADSLLSDPLGKPWDTKRVSKWYQLHYAKRWSQNLNPSRLAPKARFLTILDSVLFCYDMMKVKRGDAAQEKFQWIFGASWQHHHSPPCSPVASSVSEAGISFCTNISHVVSEGEMKSLVTAGRFTTRCWHHFKELDLLATILDLAVKIIWVLALRICSTESGAGKLGTVPRTL